MELCIGKWGEGCRSVCAWRYLGGAAQADTGAVEAQRREAVPVLYIFLLPH